MAAMDLVASSLHHSIAWLPIIARLTYPGTRARDQPPLFPRAARSAAVVPDANWAGHPAARIG